MDSWKAFRCRGCGTITDLDAPDVDCDCFDGPSWWPVVITELPAKDPREAGQ